MDRLNIVYLNVYIVFKCAPTKADLKKQGMNLIWTTEQKDNTNIIFTWNPTYILHFCVAYLLV